MLWLISMGSNNTALRSHGEWARSVLAGMGLKKPADVTPGPAQLFSEVEVNLEWVVEEKAYLHCLYPSD